MKIKEKVLMRRKLQENQRKMFEKKLKNKTIQMKIK